MRYAPWASAFMMATMLTAGPAQADRGFGGHPGFHDGFRGGFPAHRFDRRRHVFVRPFFHPFFFFGRTVFAPVPFALFPSAPFPSYFVAPTPGQSSCYQYQTTII